MGDIHESRDSHWSRELQFSGRKWWSSNKILCYFLSARITVYMYSAISIAQ